MKDDKPSTGGDKPGGQALLLALAEGVELFTDGEVEYGTVDVQKPRRHKETYRLTDRAFRDWLTHRYYARTGRGVATQAMEEAIGTLQAKARYSGQRRPVALRLAESEGKLYLDLCNDAWEVVEVDAAGWRVLAESPVRFIRRRGMRPLPRPRRGRVDALRPLLNADDDATWTLLVGWLVGASMPRGPYPILAVNGEQGSAKSTTGKMLRRLIDPNQADLRAAPRDEKDLLIAAQNSWVVALDNLSGIPEHLSDSLCRLATGGGFSTRELYTDDGEKLINVCRPLMFNGIEDVATRPDLLDRAIVVDLPAIPDDRRRPEKELWAEFERRRPGILGGLLDALSSAIKHRDRVELETLPRMADCAKWVTAAEPGLRWRAGTFMAVYASNRTAANESALEASPVGQAIVRFMKGGIPWSRTAADLLAALGPLVDATVRDKDRQWPKSPRALSGMLRRIAPTLRRMGIEVETGERRGAERRRIITLKEVRV